MYTLLDNIENNSIHPMWNDIAADRDVKGGLQYGGEATCGSRSVYAKSCVRFLGVRFWCLQGVRLRVEL